MLVAWAQEPFLGFRLNGRSQFLCRTGLGPPTRLYLRAKRRPAMTKIASFSLTSLTVAAILAGIGSMCPQWAMRMDVDFWSLPELHRRLEAESQQTQDLDWRLTV